MRYLALLFLCLGCAKPTQPIPKPYEPIEVDTNTLWGVGWYDPQGWYHEPKHYQFTSNQAFELLTYSNSFKPTFFFFMQEQP